MRSRLIVAIITSIIDEVVIIAVILWVLPQFGIRLPVWALALIALAFIAWAVLIYRVGSRILRKKPVAGLTDMVGVEGTTATALEPRGYIHISGELWEARAEGERIEPGVEVTVIRQEGLKLVVRERETRPPA